jgi:protein N-terminal glutamine amidohydrolase
VRAVLPEGVLYHPFYCEENVFHLCGHAALAGRERHAAVISGLYEGFVMWHQRAARGRSAPLFWDYHVILVARDPWEVWDLDTTLGAPFPARDYLRRSFRAGLPPELAPIFRVIPADVFVATLTSDRSHMRGPDGRFERPPPPWPTVSAPEQGSNLRRFTDMTDPFVGEVRSLEEMAAWVDEGTS